MTRKLSSIIVIDIEATCWPKKPPPGQEQEIIEIGVCPLNLDTGQLLDKESILVRPERSCVSEFCTQLTTLTQEQVDQGISFLEACKLLEKKYETRQQVWASYGEYDRKQFLKQCESRGIRYPFGSRHLNVKTLLAVIYRLPREVGMAQALEMLDLPLEGTHHRGADDARNIAQILAKLLWQQREVDFS